MKKQDIKEFSYEVAFTEKGSGTTETAARVVNTEDTLDFANYTLESSEQADFVPQQKMDDEVKKSLAAMGLLTTDGEIDYEALMKTPTIDELSAVDTSGTPIPNENRTLYDNTVYPYSAIVYLLFKFSDEKGVEYTARGTGFMVWDSIVLTCAHAVCQVGRKQWNREMVVLGRRSNGKFTVSSSWRTMVTSVRSYAGGDPNDEWGIIITKDLIGKPDKLSRLSLFQQLPELPDKSMEAVGFPGEVNEKNTDELWGASGAMMNVHHAEGINCYFKDAVVTGGQSGCPIISNYNYVVGIVYGINQFEPFFQGDCRLVERGLFQEVLKWLNY